MSQLSMGDNERNNTMKPLLNFKKLYVTMMLCAIILLAYMAPDSPKEEYKRIPDYKDTKDNAQLILKRTQQNNSPTKGYNNQETDSLFNAREESQKHPVKSESQLISPVPIQEESISELDEIISGIQSPFPEQRVVAIERATEQEGANRAFEQSIFELISPVEGFLIGETDNEALQAALAFCSLTNSKNLFALIQSVLERNTLSCQTLAYIGEILYEDKNVDKELIVEIIQNSLSYIHLDSSEKEKLSTLLSEIFTNKNDETNIQPVKNETDLSEQTIAPLNVTQ
jgi:hypothetical protein